MASAGALLLAAGVALAQERAIPFWPDEVPAAIHAAVYGNAALETVRELGRFHRVHGSPGFAAAAEHVKKKLLAAGLADAAVERFPADGKTRYAHFRSYYGWNPLSATLEEISPGPRLIESFPDLPVALADYSQDADVTAELVDVGPGAQSKDYDGKTIKGKLVLADGPLPLVHRLACEERGAAGFLSDSPNLTTAWSGNAWTLAALPDAEAPRLLALVAANAQMRLAAAKARAVGASADRALFEREAIEEGIETLRSAAVLFPSVGDSARDAERRLSDSRPVVPSSDPRDNRVPVRSPDVRGPLGVYYYDHLSEILGPAVRAPQPSERGSTATSWPGRRSTSWMASGPSRTSGTS